MRDKQQAINIIKNITFGVEIECSFPHDLAREYGITVNSSNWSRMKSMNHIRDLDGDFLTQWQAGYDSTINSPYGFHGIEFTSKVLRGEDGLKQVVKFFKWLEAKGARVSRSCGLHIHLGVKSMTDGLDVDESISQLLRTLKFGNMIKTAIFAQAGSAHRFLNGTWARARVNKQNAEDRARLNAVPCFGGKYFFINTQRISNNGIRSNHATIEFRAFAGTTNYKKVLNHLMTAFYCAYAGMRLQRSTWNPNFSADEGVRAFNALANIVREPCIAQFETFQENKRQMLKIGRKMAKKFQTNIRRAITRSNGDLDISTYN